MSTLGWLAFAWFVMPMAFVTGAVCALLAREFRRTWLLVVFTLAAMGLLAVTAEPTEYPRLWAFACAGMAGVAVAIVVGETRRTH